MAAGQTLEIDIDADRSERDVASSPQRHTCDRRSWPTLKSCKTQSVDPLLIGESR